VESGGPAHGFDPLTVRALGIETSCDETAAALVEADAAGIRLVSQKLATRPEESAALGGIVPELTVRQHLELLPEITQAVLGREERLEAVGATAGPGLAPALLVGLAFGKSLAWARQTSFHAIHHLEGHLFSPFVSRGKWPEFPHLALIASGGHTLLVEVSSSRQRRVLGGTRDDAAGEAFDKLARMVGLGYPGGPEIEREAIRGEVGKTRLPRPMKGSEGGDFSFSGLKNAARLLLEKEPAIGQPGASRAHFCAEAQAAIAECLADRCRFGLRRTGHKLLTVSGGVSANRTVARALEEAARAEGAMLLTPGAGWSTDNAAMIAAVTARRHLDGAESEWESDVDPRWSVESA